jgi:hypothetical protein
MRKGCGGKVASFKENLVAMSNLIVGKPKSLGYFVDDSGASRVDRCDALFEVKGMGFKETGGKLGECVSNAFRDVARKGHLPTRFSSVPAHGVAGFG